VHVQDVACAIYLALKAINQIEGHQAFNIASGIGHSVLELISTVEKITDRTLNTTLLSARAGDPPLLIGSIAKAQKVLGWQPVLSSLQSIISSAHLFASRSSLQVAHSFSEKQL
jgi:UDP-glucose 4-epimerase